MDYTANRAALPKWRRPLAGGDSRAGAGPRRSGYNPPMGTAQSRSVVIARNGMVATSQPLATEIGLTMLKEGGHAVDAAIAANAALGLMEPHMCGLGGDLFALVWDEKNQTLQGLNASGRSPKSLTYACLTAQLKEAGASRIPDDGVLSVSVPGAAQGWSLLSERFGRLPFERLLAPAISYAENGFPVSPVIARQWRVAVAATAKTLPGAFHKTFVPGGRTPDPGEIFVNQALARSYRLLAASGGNDLYAGELQQKIAGFMKEHGGFLDENDLKTHRSDWVAPASVRYRDCEVFELPPNGQGGVALQMLQMLADDDLASLGFMSGDCLHLMVEAKKLAFEDRAKFYADPDFHDGSLETLLGAPYNRRRRALIGERAARRVAAGDAALRRGDTVYLTAADADGNMASLIQSVYYPFGSGVVVPETGFVLQNRGLSFSLDPAHPNAYAPGKRPFHTIIPAFALKDGRPFLSFGVMGGDMQPQGHVQVLTNIIDFNMDLQQAGDAPRWRHDGSTEPTAGVADCLADGGVVFLEESVPEPAAQALRRRGHRIQRATEGFGGYQAIRRDGNGVYHGASESRKDGQAAGW